MCNVKLFIEIRAQCVMKYVRCVLNTTGQTVELEWTWVVLADAMGWAHQVNRSLLTSNADAPITHHITHYTYFMSWLLADAMGWAHQVSFQNAH